MPSENIGIIREKLIELYLETKIRKNSEVNYICNLIILFIDQIVNISKETFERDRKNLEKIPILDIIRYIRESLFIIIQIKVREELAKCKESKIQNILDGNCAEDYETLLRKEEAEIRQHICVEHQFKLHSENLEQKIVELEDNNYLLAKKIVRK